MTMSARITAAALALLTLLLLGVFLGGCYTVLRHPTGGNVVAESATYRSCADCHADAAYYHPYYRYGRSHSWWGPYAGNPWWYDHYWWWPHGHEDPGSSEGPHVETGRRHLWSSSGWPSGGWGFTSPPSQSGKSDGPPRSAPPKTNQNEQKKKDESEEEKKKEKEKDERHLWDARKKGS